MVKFLSRKTVLIGVGIVAVLSVLFFTLPKSDKTETAQDNAEQPATFVPELSPDDAVRQTQSLTEFEAIAIAYNQNNYESVVNLAKDFGKDTYNGAIERINGYYFCMRSAFELKDDTNKNYCYEQANALVATLGEQGESEWRPILEAGLEGKNVVVPEGAEDDLY